MLRNHHRNWLTKFAAWEYARRHGQQNVAGRSQRKSGSHHFGEDIEDQKAASSTDQKLHEFPNQVLIRRWLSQRFLAWLWSGLVCKRPVFELQFIDFISRIQSAVTNISTLRWRSFGNWKCPLVIYAPYGAYLPGKSVHVRLTSQCSRIIPD